VAQDRTQLWAVVKLMKVQVPRNLNILYHDVNVVRIWVK
jgi:hypothetical protein